MNIFNIILYNHPNNDIGIKGSNVMYLVLTFTNVKFRRF